MNAETPNDSPYLTAKLAAAYLHINEKKLYELANAREVPAAKVGGKWLFPRALLDAWLLEQAHGGALTDRLLLAGSDDPWLATAMTQLAAIVGNTAFVAYAPNGTLPGLELLAQRRISACALHWGPLERSDIAHPTLLRKHTGHEQWTLICLARREQGIILRPGIEASDLETLAGYDYRWAMRQGGAGSQHYLLTALTDRGFRSEDCSTVATALSERQAAALVAQGIADCAPGTRGAAGEFGLNFLPLGWEAFDLALPKTLYFRRLFQQLLELLGSEASRALASRLGGYDLSPLGHNLPVDQ
jgi:putative molybdopterin biosynthesis protein